MFLCNKLLHITILSYCFMYFTDITSDATEQQLLKTDSFGSITRKISAEQCWSERRWDQVPWWCQWLAARLAAREARALRLAASLDFVPRLLAWQPTSLCRQWQDGQPMQLARPTDPAFFRRALRQLRLLHRLGIAHNDLAKEPNWLVTPNGHPALIDFQLATISRRRGRWFRTLAREDIRHLLKHKRTYCPDQLTRRQLAILDKKALPAAIWMRTGKPIYLFVTRRILKWSDREGANDRNAL